MVNSTGYNQRDYPEKRDTKGEKLGIHWKLKDQIVIAISLMKISDDGNLV